MSYGTNYTKALSPAPASFMGAEWDGRVVVQTDTFTFASHATGTEVVVGVLKKGEVFLGAEIENAALGSGVTLQLGDAGDDDRYLAAASAASAGTIRARRAGTNLGMHYKATADTPIILTTGGAAATGAVYTTIFKARQ